MNASKMSDNIYTSPKWKPFKEARKIARSLKLRGYREWTKYSKYQRRFGVPSNPYMAYKKQGWEGWHNFLGKKWRSFEKAKKFAQSLKLKSSHEWKKIGKKRPHDIPCDPRRVYKNKGWKGWGDWLGDKYVNTFKEEWKSFKDAKKIVKPLELKNCREWYEYIKSNRPIDIPSTPCKIYKNQWISWRDWLGIGNTYKGKWKSFGDAKKFVKSVGLKNCKEWNKYSKSNRPIDIPSTPYRIYENEWISWRDWLGKK